MQSGISASADLHSAFNSFSSDASQFCLPVTIKSEALVPLDVIPFSSSPSAPDAFFSSLPSLSAHLEPKTPIYLLLRRGEGLIALTYIPSTSPVRAKTLFASTRATLVRELGSEKFADTVFATEIEEVSGEGAWKERDAEADVTAGRGEGEEGGSNGGFRREDLMGDKERELAAVRRAEEEARSGTRGRDVGIGGTIGAGIGGGLGAKVAFPVDEDVRVALRGLQASGAVQLAMDIPTETLKLISQESDVSPASLANMISKSSPRYTFYHYPDSEIVIFIYTCPSSASIKERMVFASCRRSITTVAEGEGLVVAKKIEASSPEEVDAERLREEVHPPQNTDSKRGFARPKRPGR